MFTAVLQLVFEFFDFLLQGSYFNNFFYQVEQFIHFKGFGKIVIGPVFHRFYSCFHGGIAGHDNDLHRLMPGLDLFHELYAVHPGHPDIHEQKVEPGTVLLGELQCG